ncbi:hypothetical protein [Amycolatopsis sp. MEPSY49]|uniref:hypothetical protein n=1 Tax=Amycolatopsis sp. MEPSY49 TaxID=3151600 RepID=UPI003EF5DA8B
MGYGSLPLEQQLAMVQAEQGNIGAFGEIGRKWQAARTALETAEGQLTEHASRISGAWQDDAGKSFVRRTTDGTTSLRTHAQRIAAAAPWTALDAAAQAVPVVAQYVAQCLEQARRIQAAAAQASGAPTESQVKQLQEAAGAKMDELGRLYVAAAQRLRAAAGENGVGGGSQSASSRASAGADGGGAASGAGGGGGASADAGGASGGADAAGGAESGGAGPQASGGAEPGAVPAPEAPQVPDLPSPVAPTLAGLESVAPPVPPSVTPVAPTLPSAAGASAMPGTALGGLAGLAGSVRLPGAAAIPQVAAPRATTVTPATAAAPVEPAFSGPAQAASARPASGGFPGMMPPMSGALTGSGQRPGPGRAEHPFTGRGPARRQPPGVPERLGGRARGDHRGVPAEDSRWSPGVPRLDEELWEVAPPPSVLRSDRA